jgi:hypothetical protein
MERVLQDGGSGFDLPAGAGGRLAGHSHPDQRQPSFTLHASYKKT